MKRNQYILYIVIFFLLFFLSVLLYINAQKDKTYLPYSSYMKKGSTIYFRENIDDKLIDIKITGADSHTFSTFITGTNIGSNFAKDKNSLYHFDKKIAFSGDLESISFINIFFRKDKNNLYSDIGDTFKGINLSSLLKYPIPVYCSDIYRKTNRILLSDSSIFIRTIRNVIKIDGINQKNIIFYTKSTNPCLISYYFNDGKNIFFQKHLISGADIKTFQLLNNEIDYAKDITNYYHLGKILTGDALAKYLKTQD